MSGDIRTMAVKLLKAHHLRYMNFEVQKDPQTGVPVHILMFRRDKKHSPKAFFDALNEVGLQYKKLSKDPEALEVSCELWPKGQKRIITEMRQKSNQGAGAGKGEDDASSGGNSNAGLRYLEIPNGEANAKMIQGLAQELVAAGYEQDAHDLVKMSVAQDWDEFRRKAGRMFQRLKLHTRPEIRQLREQIAGEIISMMGLDADLFSDLRGSDLEKKINEVIQDNIDLILDTRGIADSVLRRTAQTDGSKIARLKKLRRGLKKASAMGPDDNVVTSKVARLTSDIETDIRTLKSASGEALRTDVNSPLMTLISERNVKAAFLLLLGP